MNSITKMDFAYTSYDNRLIKRAKEQDARQEKTMGDYFFLCLVFCAPTVLLLSILLFL